MSAESIAARNGRWGFYRTERIRKGRPATRIVYRQYDITAHAPAPPSVVWDPILALHAARSRARFVPEGALRYGEIRARALSPEGKLP